MTSTLPDPRIERLEAWEANLRAKEAELKEAIKMVRVGMQMLSMRVLTLLGLCVASILFGVAIYTGDWAKIASAALFTGIVFLPILWCDRQH